MATSVKEMMAAANAAVPRLNPAEAAEKIKGGNVTVVDVRDPNEVWQSGKLKGAVAVSRGLLEFKADPESPTRIPELRTDQPVLLYCGSGGRAALAGKMLKDLGYQQVFNIGGFKELADSGIETESVK